MLFIQCILSSKNIYNSNKWYMIIFWQKELLQNNKNNLTLNSINILFQWYFWHLQQRSHTFLYYLSLFLVHLLISLHYTVYIFSSATCTSYKHIRSLGLRSSWFFDLQSKINFVAILLSLDNINNNNLFMQHQKWHFYCKVSTAV